MKVFHNRAVFFFGEIMNQDIHKLFALTVINQIRKEIQRADGNEVFFAGEINANKMVTSVVPAARGNEHAVPVQQDEKRKCSVLIHNHPNGILKPSNADLNVAENAAQDGKGFYIINNDLTDVYVVVEPVLPKVIKPLDPDDVADYLSEGGPLSVLSEYYEEREVQLELVRKITKTFNNNAIGVFEAGTGVGKSYGYLLPSVIWAIKNNERIIISTGTINLQQQLCEKDIPMVEKIIGKKVKYILMKGRQNYVCKRRLEDAVVLPELFTDDVDSLNKIAEWAENSPTGSKSDLSFMPPENIWTRINSESDACMGMRCPFHSECFVMKVRKEAASSNILVVNHHLLFADIESRMHGVGYDDSAVLPPYRRIVFDEAHGIEASATSFFSESVNRFKILKQVNLLYRKRKNTQTGFLCTLAILSSNEEKASSAYEMVSRIKSDVENLDIAALDLLNPETSMRLTPKTSRAFGPIITLAATLARDISNFIALVQEVMEGISEEDKEVPAFWETKILLRRLQDVCVVLQDFSFWEEKPELVFWIQKRNLSAGSAKENGVSEYVTFTQTPLDIAPLMNNGVFEPMESVVCTSATLKTGKDFGYWTRRVGIGFVDKERIIQGEFLSPFPYKKNMLFAVPNDIPFPDDVNFQTFVEKSLVKLINAAEGRTLVLFTSYESLKNSFNAVKANLRNFSGMLLQQGSDDNAKLLDLFRNQTESVLFATDSFWQGVDVPGESLSQVIIVKLPFTVPNDPIFKARSEAIELKGGSSFMELSLPDAIIKFRQGVGRLMRRSTDKGAVVVLDRRIYEKYYGKIFLQNIPESKKVYDSLDNIASMVSDFIFN